MSRSILTPSDAGSTSSRRPPRLRRVAALATVVAFGGADSAVARTASSVERRAVASAIARVRTARSEGATVKRVEISDIDRTYGRAEVSTRTAGPREALVRRSGSRWVVVRYGSTLASACTGAPGPVLEELFGPGTACATPPPTAPTTPAAGTAAQPLSAALLRDGSLLKETSSSAIFLVMGGAKLLTSPAMYDARAVVALDADLVSVVRDGSLADVPTVPRDGTVLRQPADRDGMWLIAGGARVKVASTTELRRIGNELSDIRTVPDGVVAPLPSTPRDGAVLREYDAVRPTLVVGGGRVSLDDASSRSLGISRSDVRVVPNGALDKLTARPADGTIVKEPGRVPTFVIVGGAPIGIPSEAALRALGKTPGNVVAVPTGYLTGLPKVPASGTVLRETGTGLVAVIAGGAAFVGQRGFPAERLGAGTSALTVPEGSLQTLPAIPAAGTLWREASSAAIWLYQGSARFAIPSPGVLALLGRGPQDVVAVPDGSGARFGTIPPNGTLLRGVPSQQVWRFVNGRRLPASAAPGAVGLVPDSELLRFPLALSDGTFVKASNDPGQLVWVIVGGARFALTVPAMATLGYADTTIRVISPEALTAIPFVPVDGTILGPRGQATVYLVAGRARIPIANAAALGALGYPTSAIRPIPAGGETQIPLVPRDGTLLLEVGPNTVWQIIGGQRRVVNGSFGTGAVRVPAGSLTAIPIG